MAERDLFSALRVCSAAESAATDTLEADRYASRIDVGWAAWRATPAPAQTAWLQRWRFRLRLWQHFGRAQFFVQIDDSYHTATSLRIRQRAEGGMDILLIQTASLGQCLRGLWQHRQGKPAPVWRKQLTGHELLITRYPANLASASLPDLRTLDYGACAEVLLDGQHAGTLPLRISSVR